MIDNTKQDAELIRLALKYRNSIMHRPELYYTIVPGTGVCGLMKTEDLSIGELIDIWDQVPGAYLRCPQCLRPAPFTHFVTGLSLRLTRFICPECGVEHSCRGEKPNNESFIEPLREVRKTYGGGMPQGFDWYTTFRDEMKRIEILGEPTFDTPRLPQPVFPQTLRIKLYI